MPLGGDTPGSSTWILMHPNVPRQVLSFEVLIFSRLNKSICLSNFMPFDVPFLLEIVD